MPGPIVKHKPDWWILFSVFLLLGIGLLMVFSSSQYFASYEPYNDSTYFLRNQCIAAVLGVVALAACYHVGLGMYQRVTGVLMLAMSGLLIFMVVSSQIATIGGAQRWMTIGGFSFQPSELAKVVLPLFMALYLSKCQKRHVIESGRSFVISFVVTGFVCALIFLQKDLSSTMVVGATAIIMMFCAGIRIRYLLGTFAAGMAAVAFAIILEPYRMERVYAWLNPWAYPKDEGYQAIQSLLALGSGGMTGVGLGDGSAKLYYLPSRHTDFIFSVLGEELGFVGCVLVILLFALFIWRGIRIAVYADSSYVSLLALGLTSSIAVQAFINLGVVTGLLPVTGVTLPFVSYGGTSLLVSLAATGMLLKLSRFTRK